MRGRGKAHKRNADNLACEGKGEVRACGDGVEKNVRRTSRQATRDVHRPVKHSGRFVDKTVAVATGSLCLSTVDDR
jgi:hypothetical protein